MDKHSNEFTAWRELGLSVRAANILVQMCCASMDDVRRLGAAELMRAHGIGPPTFNEIARLLGWPTVPLPPRRMRRPHPIVAQDDQLSTAAIATVLDMITAERKA